MWDVRGSEENKRKLTPLQKSFPCLDQGRRVRTKGHLPISNESSTELELWEGSVAGDGRLAEVPRCHGL